jgi:integrase
MRLFVKLLRFAFETGLSSEDKSRYCMKVQFYGGEKIPPTFTTDEIGNLLAAIDRSTSIGKRNYAMIMLSTRTGLRPCDIIGLKFSHLRFDTDSIEISQQKTGKMLTLPLTEETGSALIDYLRNGRPDSEYDNVFIRHRAPYKPFVSRGNRMIGRHMNRAGIEDYENRQPGFRAFRHSLAGNLLDNNISIYKIQGILGHDSPDTTMRYVKIDTKGLKTCALEVPLRQSR